MCGLTGYIDQRPATRQTREAIVSAMAQMLYHRGPDDGGTWVDADAGVALGFRRLSIIDLSPLGHQPMVSASGRYVIVFNGEIYNFKDVNARLAQESVTFRGHSDTEVLLEAVARWGARPAIAACEGMFALAIWDRETRTLTLARDRAGIKPLYWGLTDNVLLFGSELKALRRHPTWRREIDRDAVALFMRYGYVPAPYSIYRGVWKLEPGTILTYRPGVEPMIERYWDVRQIAETLRFDPVPGSDADRVAMLEHLMQRSVKNEMVSDVPLGAFLSGGIDSSLVTALMQANNANPIKTFSIGFNTEGFNEARHAAAVAQHLGTEHTELYVSDQDVRDVIPMLPVWYDEPFADSSQIPTFLVSRLAREHVTVALSGDGGDEMFAGYPRYRWARSLNRAIGLLPGPARRVAGTLMSAVPNNVAGAVMTLLPPNERPQRPGQIAEEARSIAPRLGRRRVSPRNRVDLERSGKRRTRRPRAEFVAHRSAARARAAPFDRAHDAQRSHDLSAGRHSREGGSGQHGGEPRSARAAAQSPYCRTCVAVAVRHEAARQRHQMGDAADSLQIRAEKADRTAEAGFHGTPR